MVSVKIKFNPSKIPDAKGSICYQLSHERKTTLLFTDYHIYNHEWNDNTSNIMRDASFEKFTSIDSINEGINRDLKRLKSVIYQFESNKSKFSLDDLIASYMDARNRQTLFNFMEYLIAKLKKNGKIGTAANYDSTLKSFRKFRNESDLLLDEISSELIEEYESYLYLRGVIPNTVSFYMRILRAVCNQAVDKNLMEQKHPFRHVYTGIDKTVKRALTITQLREIKNLNLSDSPPLEFARDMFLMSFYLRGMSLIDMAFLKKNNLRKGHLEYRRKKTGQVLTIAWTAEMQILLEKYPRRNTDYVLPIINTDNPSFARAAYKNAGTKINYNLKRIGELINLPITLTLYVARHSWASIARTTGIPIKVISQGLGHDSESTTQIYLDSLGANIIDEANKSIIKSL